MIGNASQGNVCHKVVQKSLSAVDETGSSRPVDRAMGPVSVSDWDHSPQDDDESHSATCHSFENVAMSAGAVRGWDTQSSTSLMAKVILVVAIGEKWRSGGEKIS